LRTALEDNQIRALASTTPARAAYLPDVPSVHEAGLPGFDVVTWNGFFVPANTPADLIDRINRETRAALLDAELRRRFHELGLEPQPSSPGELGARMVSEVVRWARVIREAGIERQ